MLRHLGYMGSTHSIDACTTRTCKRLEATPERVRGLIHENLRDLARILKFNVEHGIAFYRVSSSIIPWGSVPDLTKYWWDEFGTDLERIGQFIRRYGLRLEMHPGLKILLNALSPETVALSILELSWHVRFLEAMQLDQSHKLVVRVGGLLGEPVDALERFVSVIKHLPKTWRNRLTIENHAGCLTSFDLFDVAQRTEIPLVSTFPRSLIHHQNDSLQSDLTHHAFDTWQPNDGLPIVHLGSSTQSSGPLLSTPEWVDSRDLETVLAIAPAECPFDCMLETNQAEPALFELRESRAVRQPGYYPGWQNSSPLPVL